MPLSLDSSADRQTCTREHSQQVGENMSVRRFRRFQTARLCLHPARIGVVVELLGDQTLKNVHTRPAMSVSLLLRCSCRLVKRALGGSNQKRLKTHSKATQARLSVCRIIQAYRGGVQKISKSRPEQSNWTNGKRTVEQMLRKKAFYREIPFTLCVVVEIEKGG
jgi:translation elongation factor EF-Ts